MFEVNVTYKSDSKTYNWFAFEMAHTEIISFSKLPHTIVANKSYNDTNMNSYLITDFILFYFSFFHLSLKTKYFVFWFFGAFTKLHLVHLMVTVTLLLSRAYQQNKYTIYNFLSINTV